MSAQETIKKLDGWNFFQKNTRLAQDMAILVIFHKKGVIAPRFFAVGFG